MDFEKIITDLKNKVYHPVYFLMGEEPFFIDEVSNYIEKNVLVESEKAFNQTILYGGETNILTVLSEAKSYPMMSNYRVVIIKEAQNMKDLIPKDKVEVKVKEDKRHPLEKYLDNPQKSTILVFCHKYKTVDMRTVFAKNLSKRAVVMKSESIKDYKVSEWVQSYLTKKKYSIEPKAEGTIKWGGLIGLKDPSDPSKVNYYPFKSEYKAAKPTIVVSPDKMNLFYIGVDNPVSVSVPGIASEDLQPSVSGGSMSGSRGKYIVRVTNPGECTVNVSARTRNGVKSMGTGVKFRVKNVPAPVAVFMGLSGTGVMSQVQLKHATIVVAELKDFEFDLKFPVVGFTVSMTVGGVVLDEPGNSATLNEKQKSLLAKAKKGMKVNIENVKWKRPDGKIIDIGGVGLKVI